MSSVNSPVLFVNWCSGQDHFPTISMVCNNDAVSIMLKMEQIDRVFVQMYPKMSVNICFFFNLRNSSCWQHFKIVTIHKNGDWCRWKIVLSHSCLLNIFYVICVEFTFPTLLPGVVTFFLELVLKTVIYIPTILTKLGKFSFGRTLSSFIPRKKLIYFKSIRIRNAFYKLRHSRRI